MQFSDTTNKNGILQMIEQETKLGLTYITGDASRLAYWTEKVNLWLHIASHWIHQVDGEWHYDDHNHGDFPIETYTAVDDQQDYALDSEGEIDGRVIRQVEIRDASTEEYSTISLQLERDRAADRFNQDSGTPTEYWLSGGSIIFDVPIDTDKVDYFRITYDRNAHLFATNDTTAEAGFDKKFHWLLIYGPVMDWASGEGKNNIYTKCHKAIFGSDNKVDIGLKRMLQKHYLRRNQNYKPAISRQEISWK
jgi:hypothetical protein